LAQAVGETQMKKEEITKNDHETSQNSENKRDESGLVKEYGGPKGPEPTRYGDWERNGRCSDF